MHLTEASVLLFAGTQTYPAALSALHERQRNLSGLITG